MRSRLGHHPHLGSTGRRRTSWRKEVTLDHLCATIWVSLAMIHMTCSPAGFLGPSELPMARAHPTPHVLSELQPPRAQTPNMVPPSAVEKVQKQAAPGGPGAQAGGQRQQSSLGGLRPRDCSGRTFPFACATTLCVSHPLPRQDADPASCGRTARWLRAFTLLLRDRPQPSTRPSPALTRQRPGPRLTEEPCDSFQHPFFFSN